MAVCGVDTSILVRLASEHPADQFERTFSRMTALLERGEFERFEAGSVVIAESYFALQHHYGFPSAATRTALYAVLTSGLVWPADGEEVLAALSAKAEPGLIDRLIRLADAKAGQPTLTLDRKMARLSGCRLLV